MGIYSVSFTPGGGRDDPKAVLGKRMMHVPGALRLKYQCAREFAYVMIIFGEAGVEGINNEKVGGRRKMGVAGQG